jgi:hypothetical protein
MQSAQFRHEFAQFLAQYVCKSADLQNALPRLAHNAAVLQ